MVERVRVAHKDGFRASKIFRYRSQNLNFHPEMGSFLTCSEKFVEFCIYNDGFLSF